MIEAKRLRAAALAAAAALACATAVGCGSSDDDTSSTAAAGAGTTATSSSGGDAPGLAEAKANVDRWLRGTSVEPVTDGSPAIAPGKNIWVISCGQLLSSCARGTKGAVEGARAVGWKTQVFDTKGDLSSAGDGIRQAIAAKADGIYVYFIDCSYMRKPLEEAKAAGIPVVQSEGVDCDQSDSGAPRLFTWTTEYVEGDMLTWIRDFGRAMTSYLIVAGEGKGNVLYVADNAAISTRSVVDGFEQEIATCTECKSKVVEYSFDEIAKGLSSRVQDELLRDPKITQVGVAYDALLNGGVSEGVQQAERTGRELTLTAGEGQEATMDLVRDGVAAAGVGLDNEWEGWSGVDSLNRLFAGRRPVSSGIGIQLYDKDHNTPESGPYVSTIDFRSAYKQAWGIN